MNEKTEKDFDERHRHVQNFTMEFKALVRKYMKEYPENDFDAETLMQMQDVTSCYSPFIWS